ncbi:MAG: hydroxyectoine utilization dehydratase EutB [Deltaproteobacteria bacterium]|jgi:threonine dehydratase|nr:hydroxyectoine utilization dehydratase EutB [Deltaproteobacteria bacterium]
MPETNFPNLADVFMARKRIKNMVVKTPLIKSTSLSRLAGADVYLKLETVQPTGSFKARGAANKIVSLSPEQKENGVIAFSTGNHGRAVAEMSRRFGLKSVICLSERVPSFRVEAMRALGAEVVAYGQSQDEAYAKALSIQKERNLTMVAPFDDPMVISGQGTIALEIFEDLPETASVAVPLSGGGLFAGVAMAAKSINPKTKLIGVSMAVAPAMIRSLEAGKPVEIPEKDSLADALLGGIGLDNQYTFPMTRQYIDQQILVSEEEIGAAMVHAFLNERRVIEGSGAVGIAALLAGKLKTPGPIVLVISGGNVDPRQLHDLVAAKIDQ